MATEIKDLASSSEKWSRNASAASSEFATNAAAKADKWGRNAVAAAENYRLAISAAGIMQRFAKGVARAVQAGKFAKRLGQVGQSRYAEGVNVAKADWVTGFEPYHSVLQTVVLPPRRPRGDAANYERVKAIGTALNAKRIALLG